MWSRQQLQANHNWVCGEGSVPGAMAKARRGLAMALLFGDEADES